MTQQMILDILRLTVGFSILIAGITLLKYKPGLGGFLLGGLLAAEIAVRMVHVARTYEVMLPAAAFLIGGLIGAVISFPLRILLVVLTSSVMGALVGMIAGIVISQGGATHQIVRAIFTLDPPPTSVQLVLMLVLAIFFALLSIRYEGTMTAASTGFVGAFLFLIALAALFGNEYPLLRYGVFQLLAWGGLGLAGMILQIQYVDS